MIRITRSHETILRPGLGAAVLFLALVPLAGCGKVAVSRGQHDAEIQAKSREIERLKGDAKLRDEYVGELTNTWNDVQDAISAVETEQKSVQKMISQSESKGPVSQSRRDILLARVNDIQATLKSYRERLARLEKKLSQSTAENSKLHQLVAKLTETVEKKEEEIRTLRGELEGLRTTVAKLEEETQEKARVIGEQTKVIETRTSEIEEARRELDKSFWIQGTDKTLLTKGVVVATGGFIGLGKSLQPAGTLDPSLFERLEISKTRELTIPARLKDVKLVTSHAKGSYELVAADPKTTTLKITNAEEFWKLGKFLIVEIDD